MFPILLAGGRIMLTTKPVVQKWRNGWRLSIIRRPDVYPVHTEYNGNVRTTLLGKPVPVILELSLRPVTIELVKSIHMSDYSRTAPDEIGGSVKRILK